MTTHKLPDTDGQGVLDIQYVDWITTPELVDDPTNSDARRDIKPPISRPRNAKVNNMPFYAGSSAPLTGPVSWDPPSTIPTYEDPIGTFVPSPITYSLVVRRLRVNVNNQTVSARLARLITHDTSIVIPDGILSSDPDATRATRTTSIDPAC